MKKDSIKKNYIYNLIYQILLLLLPLITIPYISRILGPKNIGIYSYTMSIVTYFVLFGTLGIASYGRREIAYVQNDEKQKSKVFFEILILRLISLIISLLLYITFFAFDSEYSIYYRIFMLELLSASIDISWFYQGIEIFKKVALRNCFVKLLSVASIFIFVKNPEDLWIYIVIYCLSNFFGNITLFYNLKNYLVPINFRELNIFRHLIPTISLFIPQIAVQVYTVLDKTMLGTMIQDITITGFYDQAEKIIKIPISIITSIGIVLQPHIANLYKNKKEFNSYIEKSILYTFLLSIPMIFGVFAIFDVCVPLFLGEGYNDVVKITYALSPIILFIGMSGITGPAFLVPLKKEKRYAVSVITGAIANVCLNFMLIPHLGAVGASISTAIAEFLVLIIQLLEVNKTVKLISTIKKIWKYIISSIIMFAIIISLKHIISNELLFTVTSILSGILVYFLVLFLLKDTISHDLLINITSLFKKNKKIYKER